MTKIVLEHYPVSRLPEDMRRGLDVSATVKVMIEPEAELTASDRAAHLAELLRQYRKNPEAFSGEVTTQDAVARIRELRDEWDY